MIFRFRELAAKGNTIQFKQQLDLTSELSNRTDLVKCEPIAVDLKVTYVIEAVEVTGTLGINAVAVCARCLSHHTLSLIAPFNEVFVYKPNDTVNEDVEDENDEIEYVSEDSVDLRDYVIEAVFLALPFIPLCSDQCKGLCAECGQNRNEQQCDCRVERIDPRLAVLKDFSKK